MGRGLEQIFLKRKQCKLPTGISLIIREMQIKTTVNHHLIPVRIAAITMTKITRMVRIGRKGNHVTLLVQM
jgi:hypothetical protein